MLRRTMKKVSVLLLAFMASVGVMVGLAAPAQAAPWNCPISGTGVSRSTICYQGAGEYRVAIHCITFGGFSSRVEYGPWMSTSYMRPSDAWCNGWTEYVGSAWAQTR